MLTLLSRGTRPVRPVGVLHRCVVVVVAASCATLLAFQVKLAVEESTRLPPWKRHAMPDGEPRLEEKTNTPQQGRESRTERQQRIMERQIFRLVPTARDEAKAILYMNRSLFKAQDSTYTAPPYFL